MLKKAFRIPIGESFAKVPVYHTSLFILKVKKNGLAHSRFGFVISKKVDKRAVVRNRMRRVWMSIIEDHKLNEKKGYDMLFIFKKSTEDRDMFEQMILNTTRNLQQL